MKRKFLHGKRQVETVPNLLQYKIRMKGYRTRYNNCVIILSVWDLVRRVLLPGFLGTFGKTLLLEDFVEIAKLVYSQLQILLFFEFEVTFLNCMITSTKILQLMFSFFMHCVSYRGGTIISILFNVDNLRVD